MPKFEVGEIVIIKSKNSPEFNGQETEILEEYIWHERGSDDGRIGYQCTVQPTEGGWFETALRKLPHKEDARKWFDEKIKLSPKVFERVC